MHRRWRRNRQPKGQKYESNGFHGSGSYQSVEKGDRHLTTRTSFKTLNARGTVPILLRRLRKIGTSPEVLKLVLVKTSKVKPFIRSQSPFSTDACATGGEKISG